jgi:response regulator RpfG family c-di-GMP phosphodiesterase
MNGKPILCVDDDPHVRSCIKRVLALAGHTCDTAGDAREARRLLAAHDYGVVLCDIGLPGESGLVLLAELARRPAVATVMVTADDDPSTADQALSLGAYGYLTKPFVPNDLLINVSGALRRNRIEEARSSQLERAYATIATSEADLRHAYAETVLRLSRAMEFHDVETGEHVERVAKSASAIARKLGLPDIVAERLRLASPLHDIGKIAIGEAILRKPGPLSAAERGAMERHTDVGRELLAGSGNELLELAATVAWTHHENWDGSGYPRGLVGEAIPLEGRIVTVADVFDALTSDRPYRPAWSNDEALAYVLEQRGRKFDPTVVDAFARSVSHHEEALPTC